MSELTPVSPESSSSARPSRIIPAAPVVARQTYSSPMSFIGSARRIGAWAQRQSTNPATTILAWAAALVAIVVIWSLVFSWYLIVFGLFGVFTFPYRLMRRGQRRSLAVQKHQLATMQAMMVQQQRALQESAREQE
jgi:Flp pilus assembly protein TadB